MAGDPHHNTWGGKNNTWGNRNKKPKSDNQSSSNRQEPNKIFNTLAAGALIFILAAGGFNTLSGMVSGFFNAKDKVDTAREITEAVKNSNGGSNSKGSAKDNKSLMDTVVSEFLDFDLDPDDVADILQYVSDKLNANNISGVSEKTIFLNYSAVKDKNSYEKEIIKRAKKYSKTVTFVVVNNDKLLVQEELMDELKEEVNRVETLIQDNLDLLKETKYTSLVVGGQTNSPTQGDYIITITFIGK